MTAPLAMWEVQYSWAAPGKTDPVLQRHAIIVVYQVIRRSSGDLLIDWDAVSYHWRNEEETLLAEEIDFIRGKR
jgi:hypothetical protein